MSVEMIYRIETTWNDELIIPEDLVFQNAKFFADQLEELCPEWDFDDQPFHLFDEEIPIRFWWTTKGWNKIGSKIDLIVPNIWTEDLIPTAPPELGLTVIHREIDLRSDIPFQSKNGMELALFADSNENYIDIGDQVLRWVARRRLELTNGGMKIPTSQTKTRKLVEMLDKGSERLKLYYKYSRKFGYNSERTKVALRAAREKGLY